MSDSLDPNISIREFDARMDEVRRAVDLASNTAGSKVDLREYVEALFAEKDRALQMADSEREKSASALRDEMRRAMATADAEREKSALALREAMSRSIQEGDERLREHIVNQVQQINAALHSANELELSRIGGVQRELVAAQAAAASAVAKAEVATEKRFESVNEWRGQSSDRERSQQEQAARLASTFMPREVAEAQFSEIRKHIASNTDRLNDSSGEKRGAADLRTSMIGLLLVLATLAVVISPHIK